MASPVVQFSHCLAPRDIVFVSIGSTCLLRSNALPLTCGTRVNDSTARGARVSGPPVPTGAVAC
jgi:hypothetical protein